MPEVGDPTFTEGAAEGRTNNWGEVVTRQPYRKVRLDHLLSKEKEEVGVALRFSCQRQQYFRWRCAQGSHPFSSRTRWLRPKRPMVLYWRQYGRAGGCQIPLKTTLSSQGREVSYRYSWFLPVIREWKRFRFLMTDKDFSQEGENPSLYLENRILNKILKYQNLQK